MNCVLHFRVGSFEYDRCLKAIDFNIKNGDAFSIAVSHIIRLLFLQKDPVVVQGMTGHLTECIQKIFLGEILSFFTLYIEDDATGIHHQGPSAIA